MLIDILQEHCDDAVDLFERRCLASKMLDLTGEDLADLDRRLRASLDGLLLGEAGAWELCGGSLVDGSAGESFVAAIVALESAESAAGAHLAEAMAKASGDAAEGLLGACCLTVWPGINAFLEENLGGNDPAAGALALESLLFRRVYPEAALEQALQAASGPVLVAGIRGTGIFRLRQHLHLVEAHACSTVAEVAGPALESLLLLDPDRARMRCLENLQSNGCAPAVAAGLLGVLGSGDSLRPLTQAIASDDGSIAREAVLGLGNLGDPAGAPVLMNLLEKEVGGVAAVALKRIFGESIPDEEAKAPPETEAVEQSGVWTPDDDLARLSTEPVLRWWEREHSAYTAGERYRNGDLFRPQEPALTTPLPLMRYEALEWAVASTDVILPSTGMKAR